jgi:hypothetical protein
MGRTRRREGREPVERNRHKTSVEWPVVVDERLRLLVGLIEQNGHAGLASASELLAAALICEQPIDGARPADKVIRYRRTPHSDLTAATRSRSSRIGPPRRGRPRGRRQ